jgi:hypothetical protein
MAFFDIPRDEDIAPGLDELKRVAVSTPCRGDWVTHAPSPQIVKPRVTVEASLFRPSDPSVFSWEARVIAFMVVAHARRCDGCFGASRGRLTKLGFAEPVLDGFCANPSVLPLAEREHVFVTYALRIATNPSELQPRDFASSKPRASLRPTYRRPDAPPTLS